MPSPQVQFMLSRHGIPSCNLCQMTFLNMGLKGMSAMEPQTIFRKSTSTDLPSGTGPALNLFGPSLHKNNSVTWQDAEQYISDILDHQGWKIHARNYRWIGTEIDILASKGQTTIAVEVKYRKSFTPNMQSVADLLPAKKVRCIQRGLQAACKRLNIHAITTRIDLAIVSNADKSVKNTEKKMPEEFTSNGTIEARRFKTWWYAAVSS